MNPDHLRAAIERIGIEKDSDYTLVMEEVGRMDEEHKAAHALGGILTSTMMHAYESPTGPRTFLYVWEREGLSWLIRFLDRNPDGSVGNDWMSTFLELNREAILSDDGKMDFNLRAFSEKRDSSQR